MRRSRSRSREYAAEFPSGDARLVEREQRPLIHVGDGRGRSQHSCCHRNAEFPRNSKAACMTNSRLPHSKALCAASRCASSCEGRFNAARIAATGRRQANWPKNSLEGNGMYSAIDDMILKRLPHWRAYALSLTRNRAAAEDLVQDTAVRVLTRSKQFDGSNFASWSNAILHNHFVDDCRRARFRSGSIDDAPPMEIAQKATQEVAVELDETLRALEDLPPHFRKILVLNCVDGLSYEHTARRLKIPLGTVRSRLSRARSELLATVDGKRGYHRNGDMPTIPKPLRSRRKTRRTQRANGADAKVHSANASPDERLAQNRHQEVSAHV